MHAVTPATAELRNDDKMWRALKRYIIRDRQRKKEEYEAEVEEARLRKEREARERQDVMTLEETKEQIDQIMQKMTQLEKEKQQLFMQLKKLLNKDEVRKKQQQKESNEMQPIKMQLGNIQMPMFSIPPSSGQGDQSHNQGRPPPMSSHILNKPLSRQPVPAGVKRQRSPSPPYALYAHRLHQPPLKHQPVYSDHKMEDGRMGRQMARAVLWNKPPQFASNVVSSVSSSPAYYAMASSGVVSVVGERPPPLVYAHHGHAPLTPHGGHGGHGHGGHTPHASMLYPPAPQPPQIYLDMFKSRDQHQQDSKKDNQPQVLIGLSDGHHPAVSSGYVAPSPRHMPLHPSHAAMQNAKPGSITQGYPVQQSNPNVQNPNMYPNIHRY